MPSFVAVQEVGLEHRREQVVGGGDRVDVAREVEVQILHRDDLGVPAAGGAALDAEDRAERRPRAGRAPDRLPIVAETLGQRDRGRRLALAGLGRRDRRDADELARRALSCEPVDDREVDLRLVAAVEVELVVARGRTRSAMSAIGSSCGPGRCRGSTGPWLPCRSPWSPGSGRQCVTEAAAASSETSESV